MFVKKIAAKLAYKIKLTSSFFVVLLKDCPELNEHNLYDVEIRLVTCHRDLSLAINAIITFYEQIKLSIPLYVHDDGSLTGLDIFILKHKIPHSQLIRRKQADTLINKQLKNYPYLRRLRKSWQGIKLVDIPMISKSKKIIILDSDLFIYKKPTEIINWIKDKSGKQNYYMQDYKHFSELSFSECERNVHIKRMVTPFNSGLLCFHRDIINLKHVEKIIYIIQRTLEERIRYDDHSLLVENRHLVEQTAFLLIYSLTYSIALSSQYVVFPRVKSMYSIKNFQRPVCIHFTGEFPRIGIHNEILYQYCPRLFNLYRRLGLLVKLRN